MADSFYRIFRFTSLYICICATLLAASFTSCSDSEHFDELPGAIQKFVALYYPEIAVSSYSFNNGIYSIVLRNSATMTFNSSYQWITVNGRGSTLPEIFIYDRLPETLYEYLQTTSNINEVYSATHNSATYTLDLLDYTVVYDIKTATYNIFIAQQPINHCKTSQSIQSNK